MVLQYTGRQAFIRKPIVTLLLIVPLITLVAQYTNEWHHLFYRSMFIDYSEGFPLVHLVKGPLYMLHLGYSYSFFIMDMGLMIQMYRKATPRMKKQVALMMIGSLGPFGFPIIYLSDIFNIPVDISPFGFVFSGIFYMWGIYQFNMLKLAPLALQKVFESMQDAVIVVDLDNSVTGYNQSASRLIEGLHDKKAIGRPAADLFSPYPDLLVIISDVTEAVHYEERLIDNARQLAELNTFKDKMFNVVAHDIRDPLAILINLVFNPVIRDLAHVVQMNMRLIQVRSTGKNMNIISEISDDLYVFADKEMLDLIIRNLLFNAIKFTEHGGVIRLKADHAESKTIVSVSDTGAGIPADQAESLLQEAYPVSSLGTAGERGVGLGLTLCREFVHLNGGEIWFDNAPSQGSTFYFSIPTPPIAFAQSMNQDRRRGIV